MPKLEATNTNVHRELLRSFKEKRLSPEKLAESIREDAHIEISDRAIRDYFKKPEGIAAMIQRNLDGLCEILLGCDYDQAIERFGIDIFSSQRIHKYRQHLKERCNSIRVLGMSRPVNLTDIYTETRFLSSPRNRIERALLESISDKNSPVVEDEILTSEQVMDKYDRLMVLGLPGSGKSTFVKHLALTYLDKEIRRKRYLPVFIELKKHVFRDKISLEKAIIREVCEFAEIPKERITDFFKEGKFIILLDGLDEVTDDLFDPLYQDINEFIEFYPKNRFVITCRTKVFSEYRFSSFTDVEISGFNKNQVKTLVERWFLSSQEDEKINHIEDSSSEDDKNQFLSELKEYKSVKKLASNPLLLTFLLYTFEYNNGIIARRKLTLCEDTVNVFVNEWDRTRRIKRDVNLIELLERKVLVDLFSHIAYVGFTSDPIKTEWDEIELIDLIGNFLGRIGYKEDSKKILKAFEANYGIVIEVSKGRYIFLQQTFQEYFTALYAVENQGQDILDEVVESYILNHQWQEVFPLIVDRLINSDTFLKKMLKHASNLSKKEPLNRYLLWLYKMTEGLMGDLASPSWRSLFISLDLDTDFYTGRLDKLNQIERIYFHELSIGMRKFNRNRTKSTYSTDKSIVALWLAIIFALANEKIIEIFGSEEEDRLIKFKNIPKYLRKFLDVNENTYLEGEIESVIQKSETMDDKELLQELQEIQTSQPSPEDPEHRWTDWIHSIKCLMLNRFNIGHQIQFSPEEFKLLEEYVYVNRLIIRCINESITASELFKQKIVGNMLLPFEMIAPEFKS